nr:hypothetical protein [Tanacetum cinerariifolium]GFA83324.1 hypothetical protein [Tanacetum cinerariifolium]
HAQPYFFHVLIRQSIHVRLYACYELRGVDVFFLTFPIVLRPFKTLCFFNYALILRQDYDVTSSLRRGALHAKPGRSVGIVAAMEPKTIQKAVQISSALTNEAVRNGSIKKVEKIGNVGDPNKDKNDRDDNKRTRTGNAFATTANTVGRENTGTWPKCTTCNSYHAPEGPCRTCFNYNRPCHLTKDCRGLPRNVNLVNARNPTVRVCYKCGNTDHVRSAYPRLNMAQGLGENHLNQVDANNRGQGLRSQRNQAKGMAFMLGVEEARQDPNIVTGTFTLNNHFATTLFDSGADYSFVSATFIPLLGIEPSELEILGHVFDIDLIPFGHGSFDLII